MQSGKVKLNQATGKQTGKGQRREGGYEHDRGESLMSALSLGCRGTKGDQVTGQNRADSCHLHSRSRCLAEAN